MLCVISGGSRVHRRHAALQARGGRLSGQLLLCASRLALKLVVALCPMDGPFVHPVRRATAICFGVFRHWHCYASP